MYLVTDRNAIAIIAEYPLTIDGWNKALITSATLAQMPDMYPSGIVIERRNHDKTITQILDIKSAS